MPRVDPFEPLTPLERIIVPEDATRGHSPTSLPTAVSRFVADALSRSYLPAELPREALIAHYLALYNGEVQNGGHAQFVSNRGEEPGIFDLVAEGLELLGLNEVGAIFADLRAFAAAHPRRLARCDGEHDDIDPFFHALDTRFYALAEQLVATASTAWLQRRPWLSVVPDDAYRALIPDVVPDHPLREERRAARAAAGKSRFQMDLAAIIAAFRPPDDTRH